MRIKAELEQLFDARVELHVAAGMSAGEAENTAAVEVYGGDFLPTSGRDRRIDEAKRITGDLDEVVRRRARDDAYSRIARAFHPFLERDKSQGGEADR